MDTGECFPLENLISEARNDDACEAFVERSAAFEAGDLVRLMRETAGLTQKQLAQKISTSQSHLSEVERGNGLQGPTFSMLRKVANACQMTLRIETPEIIGSSIHDMSPEQRKAFAEGLGVPQEGVGHALIAARDRALATLSMAFIEQIARSQPHMAYDYAVWLRAAGRF
jgi:transcriptional regulator with XRE-family HTH domain